jgi:HEAT repeat protein
MEALSSLGEEALVERFQTVFLGWRNWHAAWESQPDERLLPPLLRLFWEGSAEVRSRAGQALARFGSAAAVPFIPVLGERQGERAQRAMEFLKALGAPAREPLLAALRDPLPAVRAKACTLLAELGGSAARWSLLETVRDESPEVQVAAIRALAQLRDPQAVPVLCQVLEEGRPEVRESAAHALGRIGSRRARPSLKRHAALWSRAEEPVKRACRAALRQIG